MNLGVSKLPSSERGGFFYKKTICGPLNFVLFAGLQVCLTELQSLDVDADDNESLSAQSSSVSEDMDGGNGNTETVARNGEESDSVSVKTLKPMN